MIIIIISISLFLLLLLLFFFFFLLLLLLYFYYGYKVSRLTGGRGYQEDHLGADVSPVQELVRAIVHVAVHLLVCSVVLW